VVAECTPGRKIVELCQLSDDTLAGELAKTYQKNKTMDRGISFPTSISVNNCAGNFSPTSDDQTALAAGDLVKVDMGVHIDGYPAVVAHSFVIGLEAEQPITGKAADLIAACHFSVECAMRLMRPGSSNSQVTNIIQRVADCFQVSPMEAVLSHELKRYVIDGNNVIANKDVQKHKVDEFEFQEYQIYALDVVMSAGEGKTREGNARTSIYKRVIDQNYSLKLPAARYVFSEVSSKFPAFPFTLRALDERRGRLGITELLNHGMVQPYPTLYEKDGVLVAQIKATILVLPSGVFRLTEHPLPLVQSELTIGDEEVNRVLALPTKRQKKKKKAAKKAAPAEAAAPADAQ
jgi:curved DNA binding protein